MNIVKKVKCVHCGVVVETFGKCACEKICLVENQVTTGQVGVDYIDLSAKLLNENV